LLNHQDQEEAIALDVGYKRNLDYIADCLSKFNQGINFVKICSLGGNAIKAMHVSQLLCDYPELNIEYQSMEMAKLSVYDIKSNNLGILLKKTPSKDSYPVELKQFEQNELTFIDFPLYHLLLDMMLNTKKSLRIFIPIEYKQPFPLIEIKKNNKEISCKTLLDINPKTYDTYRQNPVERLVTAYSRCGLILSEDGVRAAKTLSMSDDVIIGLDTNILYYASITSQLLDLMAVINTKHYVQLPNWIFFIIPSSVMTEIEHSCNLRNKEFLTSIGRAGFRAMQEIQELDSSEDYMGVSLSIAGQANPILDTDFELKKMNKELSKFSRHYFEKKESSEKSTTSDQKSEKSTTSDQKSSSGDMLIRDQFKQFLRQMDFHKNSFFLTADKSNASLARTEGLHSILFRPGNRSSLLEETQEWSKRNWKIITPPKIECKIIQSEDPNIPPIKSSINFSIPLGSLIYELAVEFGMIKIEWDGGNIFIKSDSKGEDIEYWLYKDLIIEYYKDYDGWDKLLKNYNEKGRFPLNRVRRLWIDLNQRNLKEFKDNHIAPDAIAYSGYQNLS
jgi:DNA-binding protein